jgi:thiamine biosynthesis protein ThiS
VKHRLKINGKPQEFDVSNVPGTLLELLNHLKVDQATVVAEIDGIIVERKEFAHTALREGQSIELIRFVGGG